MQCANAILNAIAVTGKREKTLILVMELLQ